jgi:ribose/xylose/arabinose/galactoside ABC-type transport system permease subunit
MKGSRWSSMLNAPQAGLASVILGLGLLVTVFAGSFERQGHSVNRFLNADNLVQMASDSSFFAVMAVGITMVIVTGGIDLSVGSIYALCGVSTALVIRDIPAFQAANPSLLQFAGAGAICLGVGLVCGVLNGVLVSRLKVHPFIITLGTMWVYRGIAFVATKGNSINYPLGLTQVFKATLGLEKGQYPVPAILMVLVTILGGIYLAKTVSGRNIYALGGSEAASRYSGLNIGRIQVGVFALSGLLAGVASFAGCSFYGAASCADAQGYELFVIASAVVGGASLIGGKGTALGAMLGAILIVLIRQGIRTLHLDQNYESIIIGCAVVVAVVLDQASARLAARRLAKQ